MATSSQFNFSGGSSTKVFTGGRVSLLAAIAASIGLTALPYELYKTIAKPLLWFSTYAHEMGHGLTAVLLGGRFDSMDLNYEGGGVAHYALQNGWLSNFEIATVAAGGLVGPAVLGAILFLCARSPGWSLAALFALAGSAAAAMLTLITWDWFDGLFVGGLGAVCLAAALFVPKTLSRAVTAFLAAQLALSVYVRGDYLFTETADAGPSDVAQMAEQLLLPYWFWGGACATFSGAVLLLGLYGLMRKA